MTVARMPGPREIAGANLAQTGDHEQQRNDQELHEPPSVVYCHPDMKEPVTNIQILYFDGCPTYQSAESTLREIMADGGITADVEMVAVNTDEDARRLKFPGSPTIRANGQDLFPTAERRDYRLGCRVYATPEGLKGSPTAEMLRNALTERM